MLRNLFIVAAGGGIGAALRYILLQVGRQQSFPYTTLFINITGSFILGLIMALSMKDGAMKDASRLFLATGVCGGFTTFSSFSFENLELLQQGKVSLAFIYIILSVSAGLLAAWLGFKIIHQ